MYSFCGIWTARTGPQALWRPEKCDEELVGNLIRFSFLDVSLPVVNSRSLRGKRYSLRRSARCFTFRDPDLSLLALTFRGSGQVTDLPTTAENSLPTYTFVICVPGTEKAPKYRREIVLQSLMRRGSVICEELFHAICTDGHFRPPWNHDPLVEEFKAWFTPFVEDAQALMSCWIDRDVSGDMVRAVWDVITHAWIDSDLTLLLTTALANSHIVVRSSDITLARCCALFLSWFLPDSRLLLGSVNITEGAGVVPDLRLQATTAELDEGMLEKLSFSRLPTSVIDLDRPLREECHVVVPTLSTQTDAVAFYADFRSSNGENYVNRYRTRRTALFQGNLESRFVLEALQRIKLYLADHNEHMTDFYLNQWRARLMTSALMYERRPTAKEFSKFFGDVAVFLSHLELETDTLHQHAEVKQAKAFEDF